MTTTPEERARAIRALQALTQAITLTTEFREKTELAASAFLVQAGQCQEFPGATTSDAAENFNQIHSAVSVLIAEYPTSNPFTVIRYEPGRMFPIQARRLEDNTSESWTTDGRAVVGAVRPRKDDAVRLVRRSLRAEPADKPSSLIFGAATVGTEPRPAPPAPGEKVLYEGPANAAYTGSGFVIQLAPGKLAAPVPSGTRIRIIQLD